MYPPTQVASRFDAPRRHTGHHHATRRALVDFQPRRVCLKFDHDSYNGARSSDIATRSPDLQTMSSHSLCTRMRMRMVSQVTDYSL